MKKSVALFAALSLLSGAVAFADTGKADTKKPTKTKIVDVWHCPMTGDAIKDHKGTGKPVVVGNYRVHFCCGGCPESFAKLSAADKKTKAEAAAKADAADKTKKS